MFADAFAKAPRNVKLEAILANVKGGKYRLQVEELRGLPQRRRSLQPRKAKAARILCVWHRGGPKTPLEHSGLLQMDLDG